MSESPTAPATAPHRHFPWKFLLAGIVLSGLSIGGLVWTLWVPESPESRFERGLEAVTRGDTQTAYKISRQFQGEPGREAYGRLLTALILARSGQYQPALAELVEPARFDPTAVRALTLAAECYYQIGRAGEAIVAAQQALQRDPDAIDARRWLASACYDLGTVGVAAEELKVIAEADPADGRPHRLLGLIEKDRASYPQAIEYYRESLRRQPAARDRDEILLELAESCVKVSQFDDALDVLADVAESPEILVLKAQCYAGLGREEEQDAALTRARELGPNDLAVLTSSAARAVAQGDMEQAITWLERAVKKHPYDSAAHYQLGQALERVGRQAEAEEQLAMFREWQKLEQEFTELHNDVMADFADARARVRLGDTALKLGKPLLAETWYTAALAIDPRLAEARLGLERLKAGSRR